MTAAGAPDFRVTSTERPFSGKLIQVRVDHIAGPDGRVSEREMVEHRPRLAE